MKRNARERADRELADLYAQVPELDCKGLCHTSCGVIECSRREHERIIETSGVRIPTMMEFVEIDRAGEMIVCPALGPDNRCTVYDVRPMICRLWGATVPMPCPYGCKPVDGGELLGEGEGYELLGDSIYVGGSADGRDGVTGAVLRRAAEAHPEIMAPHIRRGQAGDRRRAEKQLRGKS